MSHQTPSTLLTSGGASSLTIVTDAGTINILGQVSLVGTTPVATTGTAATLTVFGPNSRLNIVADQGTASAMNGVLNIVSPFPALVNTTGSTNSVQVHLNMISVPFGGTGQTSLVQDSLLVGQGSGSLGFVLPGTDGQVLISAALSPPAFANITSFGDTLTFVGGPNSLDIRVNTSAISSATTLPVTQGGTGRTVLTSYGVLIGEGTLPVDAVAGTNGQVLLAATNADPAFANITSFTNTITFTSGYNSLNIDLNLGNGSPFYPLPPQYGSTGQTILTAYGVLVGEGSLPIHVTAAGLNGQVLLAATNADPAFAYITSFLGSLSFTYGYNSLNIDLSNQNLQITLLPVEGGSTGRTVLTTFGVLIGEGSLPVDVTAAGTNGQLLLAASGADPAFATVSSFGDTVLFTAGYNSLSLDVNVNAFTPPTPLPVNLGGTGQTVLTTYGVLIGEGTLPIHTTNPGLDGQALIASSTGDPAFMFITSSAGTLTFFRGPNALDIELNIAGITFLNPLPPANGGTGSTLLTSFGVLVGEGSLGIQSTDPGTDGQLLIASSTGAPAFATLTSFLGMVEFMSGPNSLNMDLTNPIALTVQADSGSADFSGGILNVIGDDPIATLGTGSTLFIYLNTAGSFFNPLSPSYGGTGQTILTSHGVLIGEGNSPVNVTAAGTNGQLLVASSIGDPAFARITSTGHSITFKAGYNTLNLEVSLSTSDLFNPLPPSNGGTGQTVLTTFGVLIGEGPNPVNAVTGLSGQALLAADGADPAFAYFTSALGTLSFTFAPNAINIDVNAGFCFFNPLPVTNGGTGNTLLTSYGVLIGEGPSGIDATAAGLNGQVLIAASGTDPEFAYLTSFGNTLTFKTGYNSLNIDVIRSNVTFSVFQPSGGGTGQTVLTTFGVLVGEGQNPIDVTARGLNGQVLIASSVGDPAFAYITSVGGTLTFKFGYNSLNMDLNLASNPLFNPFPVANGGTSDTLLTAYSVICGGVTDTSPFQTVATLGTAGQLLTSNGVGMLPSFQTLGGGVFNVINVRTYTSLSPTVYVPSSDALYCSIECVGGGGGGGGGNSDGGNFGVGGGGGAGGYAKAIFQVASIGTPRIIVGAGGAGGIGTNPGAAGGTTSVASIEVLAGANGGLGGGSTNLPGSSYAIGVAPGGVGGTAQSAYLAFNGANGQVGFGIFNGDGFVQISGMGASSYLAGGGSSVIAYQSGNAGTSFGSGGGGAYSSGGSRTGGAGSQGIVIITEYR